MLAPFGQPLSTSSRSALGSLQRKCGSRARTPSFERSANPNSSTQAISSGCPRNLRYGCRWSLARPPARETERGLVCKFAIDGAWDADLYQDDSDWELVFVAPSEASPGLEWAYVNSDMVMQEGAFRRMTRGEPSGVVP
jgi:hypothetical protein